MNRRHYEKPAMTVFKIQCQHFINLSRSMYGVGGSGFSDVGMGGRSGYDDGGDGFGDVGMGGRSGYGDGGDGFY